MEACIAVWLRSFTPDRNHNNVNMGVEAETNVNC
jgi:hypothetical protein